MKDFGGESRKGRAAICDNLGVRRIPRAGIPKSGPTKKPLRKCKRFRRPLVVPVGHPLVERTFKHFDNVSQKVFGIVYFFISTEFFPQKNLAILNSAWAFLSEFYAWPGVPVRHMDDLSLVCLGCPFPLHPRGRPWFVREKGPYCEFFGPQFFGWTSFCPKQRFIVLAGTRGRSFFPGVTGFMDPDALKKHPS